MVFEIKLQFVFTLSRWTV